VRNQTETRREPRWKNSTETEAQAEVELAGDEGRLETLGRVVATETDATGILVGRR